MPRKIDDLEAHAEKFWPADLSAREQKSSVIPRLIETQEKFIGVLYVSDKSPFAWKDTLEATAGMPANLFLKHLIVLADVGGEPLQRYRREILDWFPDSEMVFHWNGKKHTYQFKSLNGREKWTNKSLSVDGVNLHFPSPLTDTMEDVAMLLLHGGASTAAGLPEVIGEKCMIGTLIGCKAELDSFVRQRYIHVSRITGGASANAMGQLCQGYVKELLMEELPHWGFSGHTIPGISQNQGATDMSFDIVAESPNGVYCAIEVSFQVTTNSTIERKAGQAHARQMLLHANGHHIAYVIDGAGNFQRRSAISSICKFSDCTVSFRYDELKALATYLRSLEVGNDGSSE